jgi:hypothetical protein
MDKKNKKKRRIRNNIMTSPILIFSVTLLVLFSTLSTGSATTPPRINISENILSYTFFFDAPTLTEIRLNNQTFTKIELTDCFSSTLPGIPSLPVYQALLLLPKNSQIQNIQVTYTDVYPIESDTKNKPILPEQECIPLTIQENPPFILNTTVYSQASPVFDTIYENMGVGYCRGFAILTVYLFPVQYTPATGLLTYFPEMTIVVSLQKSIEKCSEQNHSFLRISTTDQKIIQDMVTNPDILSTYDAIDDLPLTTDGQTGYPNSSPLGYPLEGSLEEQYIGGLCDTTISYPYVIITSDSLKDTTGYPYNWSSLITHRKNYSELNGTIVTVQEIDACQDYWNNTPLFNDTPCHIREFCKDAYLDWGTEYVLLGGDWDDTVSHQIVPYRLFTDREETGTYKTMACDKYYSHLDGTWYYSAQGIWGGGRNSQVNDYYAELYVGRIPAYNASMVSNAVQKIIWYDLLATDDWLSQVSFFGGNLGWTITSKQYMEELRLGTDTYRTFTGFEEWNDLYPESYLTTSERIYHADIGSTYKTFFSISIQNDNASIINHLDHSDYTSPFGLTNWQSRYNTKPFFGYSQGCLAGRFQAGYAGSEQLMCRHPERHAFALVLNTGYGYASSTSTDGPSQYIQCYFYDYFFNNKSTSMNEWQLGKAFAYANLKMTARIDISSHAWCYAWYSAHFFGDPAQVLRIKETETQQIHLTDEHPQNATQSVPLTLPSLSINIEQAQGLPFDYTIQTNPPIGNISGINTTNGSKICPITGLTYNTTYYWFVNVTDGTTWNANVFWFHTQSAPSNAAPIIINPNPLNRSLSIPLNTTQLSIEIYDPDGDALSWWINTSPYIGSNMEINTSNGTKTCLISGLSPNTNYTWSINAFDGLDWCNNSFLFTTEQSDTTPPHISSILLQLSNPMDIEDGFGWENISCTVTDDSGINTTLINITEPNGTSIRIPMLKLDNTSRYCFNTTFHQYGNYSYSFFATDTMNNHAISTAYFFIISPNWDVDNDGNCSLADLTMVAAHYGQTGTPGWIRQDIDNDGSILILDLVLLSNEFGTHW